MPLKKAPPEYRQRSFKGPCLLLLALLVRYAAAGLARGLAGGLALAAATLLRALAEIAGLESLDSLHS